jgi:hypothetical protein
MSRKERRKTLGYTQMKTGGAWEDTVEGVAVRDYVPPSVAGTAYGVIGIVNSVGDFASSQKVRKRSS